MSEFERKKWETGSKKRWNVKRKKFEIQLKFFEEQTHWHLGKKPCYASKMTEWQIYFWAVDSMAFNNTPAIARDKN